MASPSSSSKKQRQNSKQNQPTRSTKQTRSSITKNDSGNSSKRESSQSFHVERESIFANRDNSDFKWQRSKHVVGALEVKSEPAFDPREDMMPRYKDGVQDTFEEALQAWEELKLQQSFIAACDVLPAEACCCGLVHDEDASIKEYIKLLNEKWVKTTANKMLQSRGIKIDMFLWSWQNASGKSETNIMLIRFFQLSTYKFRKATNEGSFDLDDVLDEEGKAIADEDQSQNGDPVNNSDGAVGTQEMAR
ncbi:hypothetical protein IV203_000685 [Nitzschia inconspicua]|uniref:Uncharacterized protein n=1 Tax=Nitzschia inconspicua TaxID=303405 RepID=A0A9K3L5E1_9STRA|nr:hypothetical protein IV203_000685 [Nitzschia inconspicua]